MTTTTAKVEDLKLSQTVITSIDYDLGSDLLGFIGTISLLRPRNEYSVAPMHLNIDIFSDLKCENRINDSTISTKNATDKQYFQVFKSNNEEYKWIDATDDNVKDGFGEEYAKRPVVFLLGKWLLDNGRTTFNASTKYYIVYTWENMNSDGSVSGKSDVNSIIWPNFENY